MLTSNLILLRPRCCTSRIPELGHILFEHTISEPNSEATPMGRQLAFVCVHFFVRAGSAVASDQIMSASGYLFLQRVAEVTGWPDPIFDAER